MDEYFNTEYDTIGGMDSPVDDATLNSLLSTPLSLSNPYDFSASLLSSSSTSAGSTLSHQMPQQVFPQQPMSQYGSMDTNPQTTNMYYSSTTTSTTTTTTNTTFPINPADKKKRRRKDDISSDEICKGFDWIPFTSSTPTYPVIDSRTMLPMRERLDVIVYKSGANTHFSDADKAWICYRQNQFKVYCFLKTQVGSPLSVREGGIDSEIKQFYAKLYAVKSTNEGINEDSKVCLYHAGKSRVKKEKTEITPAPFVEDKAEFTNLQFERSNAAKGQPEYFHLVVTLYAKTNTNFYPILYKISPRVIVRSQHPGFYTNPNTNDQTSETTNTTNTGSNYTSSEGGTPQTETNEQPWQQINDSVVHMGKVGINTSEPTEALTVHGNALVTGDIYKPSDRRIKSDFEQVDTIEQLGHIRKLQIYDYKVQGKPERGVIAQELQAVHPPAVHEAGDVNINGVTVPNLLVVNERTLLYENIGATQQLDKELDVERTNIIKVDTRVDNLEDGTEKSAAELKGQIKSLYDMLFAEELSTDEMGVAGWKEEHVMFSINLFRMGPARTFLVLGFFLYYLWLVGALFLASNIKSRRILGGVCASKFALYYVLHNYVLSPQDVWLQRVYIFMGIMLLIKNFRRNLRRVQLEKEGNKETIQPATTFCERIANKFYKKDGDKDKDKEKKKQKKKERRSKREEDSVKTSLLSNQV